MILLLAIIYVTFLSLGLPDSLFGAAWPAMHVGLGVSEGLGSIYSIITGVGGGISSILAGNLIRRFGTGRVTFVCVLLTAVGMAVLAIAPNIWIVYVASLLLGLGAGAVDSGLNNYVACHFKASHMSWLHCFWGVGVTVSPLIMSKYLETLNWRGGYTAVAIIQFVICALLLCTLPVWKKNEGNSLLDIAETSSPSPTNDESNASTAPAEKHSMMDTLRIHGVPLAILSIGLYCGMEFLLGTWGASYAVNARGVSEAAAARWVSLYFGGIMLGRFICGFLAMKLDDNKLILLGSSIAAAGIIVLLLPLGANGLIGLVLIGIGFAPIFPSTIHAVPIRFGQKYSADVTGLQMTGGYSIAWTLQMLFGFIAPRTTFAHLPYLLVILCVGLLLVNMKLRSYRADV